jgi:hypothetical protein
MGEPAKKNLLSVEDYLEGEKTAGMRHEYVDGVAYAVVGTTKVHNAIALNIALILRGDIAALARLGGSLRARREAAICVVTRA